MNWSANTLVWAVLIVFAAIGVVRLAPLAAGLQLPGAGVPLAAGGRWRTWPRLRWRALSGAQVLAQLAPVAEAGAVVLWAMWVGKVFLDFDPTRWVLGGDFALNVQGYAGWAAFKQCGWCVLWNGTLNGGAPLFSELLSAVAHPLVVLFVLLWGPIVAMKVTVVAGLAIAGLAQWWLARIMKLGMLARLWSAAMAVVGGHLAGRMEAGLVEVLFSAAACSLVIPAILYLAQTGSRRAIVLLGVTLGLASLSGQGYMQVGLAFAILPAALLLLVTRDLRLKPVWKAFALAGVLALLLTAYYWVPFLHFFPQLQKPTDPAFGGAQALGFLPLNLVISDPTFFGSQTLGMLPFPAFYANYIGWVPVLLLLVTLRYLPRSGQRLLLFLLASLILVFCAAAAIPFKLMQFLPIAFLSNSAAGIRAASEIASLAVPLVLALAAWGVDYLRRLSWPRLSLSFGPTTQFGFSLGWLVLGVPLLLAVKSAYTFGQSWLHTDTIAADYQVVIPQVRPLAVEWVEPPLGDYGFVNYALSSGMKLTNSYRPSTWRDQVPPLPSLKVTRDAPDPAVPGYRGQIGFAYLIDQPENSYAYVDTGSARVPCVATGLAGNIDIHCQTPAAGQLIVNENLWSGWSATLDGRGVGLGVGPHLTTSAPAGDHTYRFRYLPWDVVAGLLLTLVGVIWLVRLWWTPPQAPAETWLASA